MKNKHLFLIIILSISFFQACKSSNEKTSPKKSYNNEHSKNPFHVYGKVNHINCSFKKGSIELKVFDGKPPYQYQWTVGKGKSRKAKEWAKITNTSKIENLEDEEYFVTVTDSDNKMVRDSFEIQTSKSYNISIDIIKYPSSPSNCDGSIQFDVENPDNHELINEWLGPKSGKYNNELFKSDLCAGNFHFKSRNKQNNCAQAIPINFNPCNQQFDRIAQLFPEQKFTLTNSYVPIEIQVDTIVHVNLTNPEIEKGSIFLTIKGGTGDYFITWSDKDIYQNIRAESILHIEQLNRKRLINNKSDSEDIGCLDKGIHYITIFDGISILRDSFEIKNL